MNNILHNFINNNLRDHAALVSKGDYQQALRIIGHDPDDDNNDDYEEGPVFGDDDDY